MVSLMSRLAKIKKNARFLQKTMYSSINQRGSETTNVGENIGRRGDHYRLGQASKRAISLGSPQNGRLKYSLDWPNLHFREENYCREPIYDHFGNPPALYARVTRRSV